MQLIKGMRKAFARKNKECRFDEQMYAYFRGEFTKDQRRELELHLAFCRRCVKVYHRAKLFGFLWNDVLEAGKAGKKEARERLKLLIAELRLAAQKWQSPTAAKQWRGAKKAGLAAKTIIQAKLLDKSYNPTGKTVPLKVLLAPKITKKGLLKADFMVDDITYEGRTISLTILSVKEKLATVVAKLKRSEVGKGLEATFNGEGFDINPSIVPSKNVEIYIWPPGATG